MWIEIFRSGTFTDSKGKTQTFTAEDLEQIARQYNERVASDSSLEAPVVKGHPESDSPAHGWVERLARRGNVLYAKLKQLSKEIIEEIKEGRYRRVSISMYPNYLLRHIGLLGGETPAVKGLRPIEFVELDETHTFEYSAESEDFAELRQEIRRLEIENSQLARQNESLQNQLQKAYHESLAQSFREFIRRINESSDYLLVPPSKEQALVEILEYAEQVDSYVQNANPEALRKDFSLLERIKEFLLELKPVAIRRNYTARELDVATIENPFEGRRVDEERLNLHLRAKELQKANPNLSYEQALLMANKS